MTTCIRCTVPVINVDTISLLSNSFKILITFWFEAMYLIKKCAFSYVIKPQITIYNNMY